MTNVKDRIPQDLADVAQTDPSNALQVVCDEAANRQEEAQHKGKKQIQLPGKSGKAVDLRNVYGHIISCAKRFRDVGDLVARAPGASEYVALPWLIIRTTLSAAINEHEMYGVMIQGQEMVSGLVTHYIVIERVFDDEDTDLATAVQNALLALYASIMDFLLEALRFFPPVPDDQDKKHWSLHKAASKMGHAMTRTFRSMDPTSQASIKDLLDKVSGCKTAVDSAAGHAYAAMNRETCDGLSLAQRRMTEQLEGYGLAQKEKTRRLELMMEEFNTPIHDIDVRIAEIYDNMERNQAQSRITRVLDWLSPPGRESKRKTFHLNVSSHRLENSGAWLLNDREFLHWQNSEDSSIAWLSGMTGTGKTSLISMVIDRLRELDRNDEGFTRTAYFYASGTEGSDWSDPDEIIRDVVRQLSIANGGSALESTVEQKYDKFASDGAEPSRPTMDVCVDLVVALSSNYPVTIVLDGLDEVTSISGGRAVRSTRDDLIYGLGKIIELATKPVKLLLSTLSGSEVEVRLRKAFGGSDPDDLDCSGNRHIIEVNANKNTEDLKLFIDQQIEEKITRRDLLRGIVKDDLRDKIKTRLLEHSNGMFRYANMQIARLCDDRMDTMTVLEELEKPLPDIASLYDRSINEIKEEHIDRVRIIAQTALRWLRCAQEPLNRESFLEAVSTEGAERPEEIHVRSACRMLIKAQHQSDGFTFTQPFVEERLAKFPEYSESDCHLMATNRCLRMMNATAHSVGRLSKYQISFFWYAKRYWPLHYQRIDFECTSNDGRLNEERQKGFTEVRGSLQRFIMQGHKTSPAFNKWLAQIPDLVQTLDESDPLAKQLKSLEASSDNPLHIICALGFPELIKAHHRHFDLNKRDRHGRSALTLAVENNRVETVKALLDHARVDVSEFNAKAADQLLRKDFAPIACYSNAFQAAAVIGSRTMIQTLLDHGARSHQVAGFYGCALQAACLKGHKDTADFLLNGLNFDPNNQGGFHGNALQAASLGQDIEIVEMLLEAGADEATQGGEFGTALMAAVTSENKDIINALLAHTTDVKALVNATTAKYGTPLQKAVDLNAIDIVELLIANDADINALSGSNKQDMQAESTSALAIAAWGGHKKIVSILCELQAEVDLSHEDNEFHLLHQAAQEGMLDLVQYCLNQGCDVNMATNKGPKHNDVQYQKTPLILAAMEGHVEVVKLLLQKKARIQHPRDKVTILHLAAARGQSSTIDILVKEFKHRHPESPQEAIDFVNRKIQTTQASALSEAARQGAPSAVSVLLEHGATLAANRDGVTPLHDASWFAKPLVAKLLLEHIEEGPPSDRAAQINARNRWGKTPAIDAAHRNHIKMFNLLVQHGADCTVSDTDKNSPLHYVAWRNHIEIAEAILREWDKLGQQRKEELLNHTNLNGNTALQEALHRRHFHLVRLLVEAGAKLGPSRWKDYFIRVDTQTSIEVIGQAFEAFKGRDNERLNFLNHRNGSDGYSLLHDAAQHRRIDVLELVLAHGADPTTMDVEPTLDLKRVDSKTALHVAVWEGRPRIAALLLERAAQQCDREKLARFVNRRNSVGKTALMDAAHQNRAEIMKLLLHKYHADWSAIDNEGYNALHYCAYRNHKACVELLLKWASGNKSGDSAARSPSEQKRFQVLLNQQSHQGRLTPLHDVTGQGHGDIARMLLMTYHAEYEIYDQHGDSVLHRAVQADHDDLLVPYLGYMEKDPDQEKFKRVLRHRNSSMKRTVLGAATIRHRTASVDLLKRYGG